MAQVLGNIAIVRRLGRNLEGAVMAGQGGWSSPPYYGIVSQAWLALTSSDLGRFAEGQHHGEEVLSSAMAEVERPW